MRICIALGAAIAVLGAALPAHAGSYRVLYSFKGGADGDHPAATLRNVGGMLYGTTWGGGKHNKGTVFSVDPVTGAEMVLYSFKGSPDGDSPYAGVIDVGGTLYGTTEVGGGGACTYCGTVFAVNEKTGAETVVYSFLAGTLGYHPVGGLTALHGKVFGTTAYGAGGNCYFGCGAVFRIDLNSGKASLVYGFKGGSDGDEVGGDLIAVGGLLYGATSFGGSGPCSGSVFEGCGTVFSIDPTTGAESVIYSFEPAGVASDVAYPEGGLINVGGTLYGTGYQGSNGPCQAGGVFAASAATGTETSICSLGGFSSSSLLRTAGKLFGTTQFGGHGYGSVFQVNPGTGAMKLVYAFKGGNDGENPYGGLVDVGGTFYGTTYGAPGQNGTVFAYTP